MKEIICTHKNLKYLYRILQKFYQPLCGGHSERHCHGGLSYSASLLSDFFKSSRKSGEITKQKKETFSNDC